MMIFAGKNRGRNGMAIVFAVLLISLILAVNLLLFNVTLRQLLLSLTVRDSRYAFYAANSALNCADYWDWDRRSNKPSGSPFWYFEQIKDDQGKSYYEVRGGDGNTEWKSSLKCLGAGGGRDVEVKNSILPKTDGQIDETYLSEFTVYFSPEFTGRSDPSCANVRVIKTLEGAEKRKFRVEATSWGYNLSNVNVKQCPLQSDRVVERELLYSYGPKWNE